MYRNVKIKPILIHKYANKMLVTIVIDKNKTELFKTYLNI